MKETDLTAQAILRDGRPAMIRPLQATDTQPLAAFFEGLSAETRRRYGPHAFDRATAQKLCATAGSDPCTRFVVVLEPEPGRPAIIGYLIFTATASPADLERYNGHLRAAASAGIAPAVADTYQNQGIGSLLAKYVIAYARSTGFRQLFLSGGVRAFNESAVHYYEKLGFRRAGEFWTRDPDLKLNYAMLLDL